MKLSKEYFDHYTNEQVLHLYKLLEAVRHNSENDLRFTSLECYLRNTDGYREKNRAPGFLSKVSTWCITDPVSTSVLKGIPLINAYHKQKSFRSGCGGFDDLFGEFTCVKFIKENGLTDTDGSYMSLAFRWESFNAMKKEAEGRAFDPWDFSPYPKSYVLELVEPYNTPRKRNLLSKKSIKKRTTNQKDQPMMFEDATPKTSAWPAPIQENPPLAKEEPAINEKPANDEVKLDVWIKGQKITLTIDPVAYLHDLMGVSV